MIEVIKNNKIKFSLIILFILYIIYKIINYIFFDTLFELNNYLGRLYYYNNPQGNYANYDTITEEEEYSFQAIYSIDSNEKKIIN